MSDLAPDLPAQLNAQLPDPVRAWVRMPSGKRLDLLAPRPDDWEDADLALGLARTYRWGGHSAWPLPLSVAQHSITVMLLRRAQAPAHAGMRTNPHVRSAQVSLARALAH